MTFQFSTNNYNKLVKLASEVYNIKPPAAQAKVTDLWRRAKAKDPSVDLSETKAEWSRVIRDRAPSKDLFHYFGKKPSSISTSAPSQSQTVPNEPVQAVAAVTTISETKETEAEVVEQKRPTPVQEQMKTGICKLTSNITALQSVPFRSEEQNRILKKYRKERDEMSKRLKKRIASNSRQQKSALKKKDAVKRLAADGNEAAKKLCREDPGRPRYADEDGLLHTIKEVAMNYFVGAHDRRRNEVIRSVRTLDDLHKELKDAGYNISRSGLYLRILPRSANTEGKRHVKTVPVKLCKAQNSLRNKHQDKDFCFQIHGMTKYLCSLFGPDVVFYLSNDDKARIPLGITAATKQSPLFMHMEYELKLPDHDFVKAAGHKLIPSVYAVCKIKPDGEGLTYSGATHVALRSGKHDSSTARSHHIDILNLLEREEFKDMRKTPIIIVSVDGGPDENPRFPKTLYYYLELFKLLNCDVIIVLTHAPGCSAFNYVERRMAPLSHELAGLILPHIHFGSHLDKSGKTIDPLLERQNFAHAGQTLAEVFGAMTIDKHDVSCEYMDPPEAEEDDNELQFDHDFIAEHVRQTQYCLQIVRCDREGCENCGPWRSNWKEFIPDRFLPGPVPMRQTSKGPEIPAPGNTANTKWMPLLLRLATKLTVPGEHIGEVPFDLYCPSKTNEVPKRTCRVCGIYFPSQAAMLQHRRALHPLRRRMNVEHQEEEENQEEGDQEEAEEPEEEPHRPPPNQDAPVFRNIFDLMARNPFVEADDDD